MGSIPIAGTMKFELEDIAMKHLYPEAYRDIEMKLNAKKDERQAALDHGNRQRGA